MSLPLVTRFGADPLLDLEVANKRYVDTSGGGATITAQEVVLTSNFSTTSLVFVDLTGLLLTLADRSGGFGHVSCIYDVLQSTGNEHWFRMVNGATNETPVQHSQVNANRIKVVTLTLEAVLDGDVVQAQGKVDAGTLTVQGDAGNDRQASMRVIEIS